MNNMNLTKALSALALTLTTGLVSAQESPASPAGIFNSRDILQNITVEAPLSDLYAAAASNQNATVQGTLKIGDTLFSKVTFSERGNSSRRDDQCPFHKLSLKIADNTANTILNGQKDIKIGTHCGETDDAGPIWGRIRNEKEPLRESLIYYILQDVKVVSLLARLSEITYHDTSANVNSDLFVTNPITRHAFFLEDEKEAAIRYGGKILMKTTPQPVSNPAIADAQSGSVDNESIVGGIIAEVMTQNVDWGLKMTPADSIPNGLDAYTIWNLNILSTGSQKNYMQVYDWDIANFVRGPYASMDFAGTDTYRMQAIGNLTLAQLNNVIQRFNDAKSQIYADIETQFKVPPTDIASYNSCVAQAGGAVALSAGQCVDPDGYGYAKDLMDQTYAWIATLPSQLFPTQTVTAQAAIAQAQQILASAKAKLGTVAKTQAATQPHVTEVQAAAPQKTVPQTRPHSAD